MLQLADWLKIEAKAFLYSSNKMIFSVIRKVHKKKGYPREWIEYKPEEEDAIFGAKFNQIIETIKNEFIDKANETYRKMTDKNRFEESVRIISGLYTFLHDKSPSQMTLTVIDPTFRIPMDITIAYVRNTYKTSKGDVPIDLMILTNYFPVFPLTLMLSTPFMAYGFEPIFIAVHYPLYYAEVVMVRLVKDDNEANGEALFSMIYNLLYSIKKSIITDSTRIKPVEPDMVDYIYMPPQNLQVVLTDRGIFFEIPRFYEWYFSSYWTLPVYDPNYLYANGARGYMDIVSQLLKQLPPIETRSGNVSEENIPKPDNTTNMYQ